MTSSSVIEAKNLSYCTPLGRSLQENLNFSVGAGQLFLIRGANGSGKSSLLRIMLGESVLDSGSLKLGFGARDLHYIPQLENTEVHFPLTLRDVLEISVPKVTDETIESLGLIAKWQLGSGWNTASGGERKRVLLTRALLSHPSVLVLDEPMNHLDRASRVAMIGAMQRFLNQEGMRSIVMVCHQGLSAQERDGFDIVDLELRSAGSES